MKRQLLILSFLLAASLTFAEGYEVGDKARDFNLTNIDGTTVSLQSLGEVKGAIVIFTCNHCPYSKLYEDRIIALDKKYKKQGYPVVAINPNDSIREPEDSFSNMKVRAKEKGFTFPYLLDAGQEITRAYGASRTPHVFLLQKKGNEFIVRYIGAIDNNSQSESDVTSFYVEDAIAAIEKGNDPDPSYTKAIGCTIKWAAQ